MLRPRWKTVWVRWVLVSRPSFTEETSHHAQSVSRNGPLCHSFGTPNESKCNCALPNSATLRNVSLSPGPAPPRPAFKSNAKETQEMAMKQNQSQSVHAQTSRGGKYLSF